MKIEDAFDKVMRESFMSWEGLPSRRARVKLRILDSVPFWFRRRWPLRRFYLQQEDIDAARRRAEELSEKLRLKRKAE